MATYISDDRSPRAIAADEALCHLVAALDRLEPLVRDEIRPGVARACREVALRWRVYRRHALLDGREPYAIFEQLPAVGS